MSKQGRSVKSTYAYDDEFNYPIGHRIEEGFRILQDDEQLSRSELKDPQHRTNNNISRFMHDLKEFERKALDLMWSTPDD